MVESRIPSARKLSLVVLGVILDHAVSSQETAGPALAELLRFARSDGDATVRCAAFDIVADYLGEMLSLWCFGVSARENERVHNTASRHFSTLVE